MKKNKRKIVFFFLILLSVIVIYEIVVIAFCRGNIGIEISMPYGYEELWSPDYSVYLDKEMIFTRDTTEGKTSGCRKFFLLAPGRHKVTIVSLKNNISETYYFSNVFFVQLIIECYDVSPFEDSNSPNVWIIKRPYPLRTKL